MPPHTSCSPGCTVDGALTSVCTHSHSRCKAGMPLQDPPNPAFCTQHFVPGTLCATNSMITLDNKQTPWLRNDPDNSLSLRHATSKPAGRRTCHCQAHSTAHCSTLGEPQQPCKHPVVPVSVTQKTGHARLVASCLSNGTDGTHKQATNVTCRIVCW